MPHEVLVVVERVADRDRVVVGSSTTWIRGTRIFQKLDGRWQMIHQHVSFPVDPETGSAATGLEPSTTPTTPSRGWVRSARCS